MSAHVVIPSLPASRRLLILLVGLINSDRNTAISKLHIDHLDKKSTLRGAFFLLVAIQLHPLSVLAACGRDNPALPQLHSVVKVIDGDTVHLESGEKVRLIGLNAPEMAREGQPAQPYANEATTRLKALLGKPATIRLLSGVESRDRYGRQLAHGINKQGIDITETLISEGLAFAVTIPPNIWKSSCYQKAEEDARQSKRGLWGHSVYQPKSPEQITDGGFQRIRGEVIRVNRGRNWLRLDLSHRVSIRVNQSDLSHFEGKVELFGLKGRTVTVQGWLTQRKQGYQIRLRHPSAIEVE